GRYIQRFDDRPDGNRDGVDVEGHLHLGQDNDAHEEPGDVSGCFVRLLSTLFPHRYSPLFDKGSGHARLKRATRQCFVDYSAASPQHSASLTHISVAWAMSCTLTHSSGPWMFCMPVKRLGVGTPISVRREPSVPPRIGRKKCSISAR